MIQFKRQVQTRQNLYNEYTKLLNGILGLTSKQLLVLSKLFELTESTSCKRKFLDRNNRKEILESCNIDECNLSTYLTLFKNKDILTKIGDQWIINTNIFPIIKDNSTEVSFLIEVDDGR